MRYGLNTLTHSCNLYMSNLLKNILNTFVPLSSLLSRSSSLRLSGNNGVMTVDNSRDVDASFPNSCFPKF